MFSDIKNIDFENIVFTVLLDLAILKYFRSQLSLFIWMEKILLLFQYISGNSLYSYIVVNFQYSNLKIWDASKGLKPNLTYCFDFSIEFKCMQSKRFSMEYPREYHNTRLILSKFQSKISKALLSDCKTLRYTYRFIILKIYMYT